MLEKTIAEYSEAEEKGIPYESNMYLHEYINIWLGRAKQRVCLTTYEGYEIVVRRYLIPYFKAHPVKLKDVNRRVLQNYFDHLSANGRKDGKGPLSPKSLRHIKNPLHLTLKEAVRDELLSSNPCDLVELPKMQQYDAHYYNAKQIRTLFSAIEGDILEPMIKITALYGLRRSEVLGIKWDSIDLETRRMTIKHTVVTVSTTVEKDTTKNKSSKRMFL